MNPTEQNEKILAYYDVFTKQHGIPPYHHQFIFDEVYSDNYRIHLDILFHDKGAPTVVFIPGTAGYSLLFGQVLYKIFEKGYNVVGIDPRGHGRSEGERGDYEFNDIVENILSVVTYCRNKFNNKIALLGCSQGGIAAFYACCRDTNITTAICQPFADLGSKGIFRLTPYPTLFGALNNIGQSVVKRFPNYKIPITSYLPLDRERVPYYGTAKRYTEIDPWAITHVRLKTITSLCYTPLPCKIEEVKTPICVLQGASDRVFPLSYTEFLYNKLTCEKELIVLKGLHHGLFFEAPDRVVQSFLPWLDKQFNK